VTRVLHIRREGGNGEGMVDAIQCDVETYRLCLMGCWRERRRERGVVMKMKIEV